MDAAVRLIGLRLLLGVLGVISKAHLGNKFGTFIVVARWRSWDRALSNILPVKVTIEVPVIETATVKAVAAIPPLEGLGMAFASEKRGFFKGELAGVCWVVVVGIPFVGGLALTNISTSDGMFQGESVDHLVTLLKAN